VSVWALENHYGIDSLYSEYRVAVEAGKIYAGPATMRCPGEAEPGSCHAVFERDGRVVAWIRRIEVLSTLD